MRVSIIILLCIIVVGCATAGTMRNAPLDKGLLRTFKANHELVLKAAKEAAVASDLSIEEVNQVDENTWMILCEKGASVWAWLYWGSWGERVRIVVKKKSEHQTDVYVYARRKLATNISARGDYPESILLNIELLLKWSSQYY